MGARLLALLVASAALMAAACSSDLFHDTGWPTLCELDPEACAEPENDAGAKPDSGDAGADSSGDVALEGARDAAPPDGADGEGGG